MVVSKVIELHAEQEVKRSRPRAPRTLARIVRIDDDVLEALGAYYVASPIRKVMPFYAYLEIRVGLDRQPEARPRRLEIVGCRPIRPPTWREVWEKLWRR